MTVASVQAMIARYGELITLRRYDGTSDDSDDVVCRAKITELAPEGAEGPPRRRWQVIISNAEIAAEDWPGPPVDGDEIVRDGVTLGRVEAVDTRKIGDDIATHWLKACG